MDRDQEVGTERRAELKLPQYGRDQENQRPAAARQKVILSGRHPSEGMLTVVR